MKGCWYPRTPKILCTCFTVFIVLGQSLSALIFLGSGKSLPPSTMIPRYVTLVCSKEHFAGCKKYDSLTSTSSTSQTICRCQVRLPVVAINILSTYTKSSVGYLCIRWRSIRSIAQQKVGGKLVKPKSITLVSYAPKGVLKAAFHRSSSLI
jgi:hypothetical protein